MINFGQQGGLNQTQFTLTDVRDPWSCLPSSRVTELISSASSVSAEVFKTSSRTQRLRSERVTPDKNRKTVPHVVDLEYNLNAQ